MLHVSCWRKNKVIVLLLLRRSKEHKLYAKKTDKIEGKRGKLMKLTLKVTRRGNTSL